MYASMEQLSNLYYVVVDNNVVGVYEDYAHAASHAHGINLVF